MFIHHIAIICSNRAQAVEFYVDKLGFEIISEHVRPQKDDILLKPYEYYEKYGIRKYGFHGTSHKYVSERLAEIENKNIEDLKIVTCHLGQGSSICAVDGGKIGRASCREIVYI